MATQEYAASVQGAAIRVTRLDAAGNLMFGQFDSYTSSSFIRVSFTPEYEEGDEITEKGADGTVCVSFKAPDTLKRVTIELAICDPDPELTALAAGGLLLTRQGTPGDAGTTKSVGWASPQVGENPSRDGVSLEVWSYAVKDGKKAAVDPFYKWVFPYVTLRQSGDRVIENGLLANTFEGFGLGNVNYGTGPDGRWEWPSVTERPYAFARVGWAPIGYRGFYVWDASTGNGELVTTFDDPVGTNVPGTPDYDPEEPIDYMIGSTDDDPDIDPPSITSLNPVSGSETGGTRVTIVGTNLLGATGVTFGGVAGTNLVVNSDTQLKVTAPVHATGAVDVAVTTPDGADTEVGAYTYTAGS